MNFISQVCLYITSVIGIVSKIFIWLGLASGIVLLVLSIIRHKLQPDQKSKQDIFTSLILLVAFGLLIVFDRYISNSVLKILLPLGIVTVATYFAFYYPLKKFKKIENHI